MGEAGGFNSRMRGETVNSGEWGLDPASRTEYRMKNDPLDPLGYDENVVRQLGIEEPMDPRDGMSDIDIGLDPQLRKAFDNDGPAEAPDYGPMALRKALMEPEEEIASIDRRLMQPYEDLPFADGGGVQQGREMEIEQLLRRLGELTGGKRGLRGI